jgi:hypothetical protein
LYLQRLSFCNPAISNSKQRQSAAFCNSALEVTQGLSLLHRREFTMNSLDELNAVLSLEEIVVFLKEFLFKTVFFKDIFD